MAITKLDFWYDGQQRRFLEQLVRAFSGFQYMSGYNAQGAPQLMTVPCTMANTNRQVANILRNNSENTLLSAPRISIWQTGLTGRRDDVQYPGFIDTLQVVERGVNFTAGKFTNERGNAYRVQRLMPRPFSMDVQVDLWTTNLDQRYQLLEQILTIIYPSFDIQNSQNPIDWTALTTVYTEDITLSSRNLPIGTENEIDIATLRLRVPIWLSPPAKVTAQNVIQQIIANIFDAEAPINSETLAGVPESGMYGGNPLTTSITSPGNYHIRVDGGSITLLSQDSDEAEPDTNWAHLIADYGLFRPAQSQIVLYYTKDFESPTNFVTGTLQFDPTANDRLIWQIDPDTLPANTLLPVNALIDPLRTTPGQGLPVAVDGTAYLIASDIGRSQVWGSLAAHQNDIITYRAGVWSVSFASLGPAGAVPQRVLNLYTGRQLHWTGTEWIMSIDGTYAPGYWRLRL